ncbi:hypothetical protein [Kitasatospora sp. NPDC058218]
MLVVNRRGELLLVRRAAQLEPYSGYQSLPAYLAGIPAAPMWADLIRDGR